MKIAVATDDGATISQHFGRAVSYSVITVNDGQVTGKETREKTGHHTYSGRRNQSQHNGGQGHGYGAQAESKHASMIQPITDCQVIIAGGMGMGAYQNLKSRSIEPIITDVEEIDRAVTLYLGGNLPNLMERLH